MTQNTISQFLNSYSKVRGENEQWSLVEELKLYVVKERAIYTAMNLLKIEQNFLHGRCWCPEEKQQHIVGSLQSLTQKFQNLPGAQLTDEDPGSQMPPTNFRLNDTTFAFQQIINTYGVPRYKEVNPGLFTMVTFPFQFGVMFGDIGHGFVLFMLGVYLCLFSSGLKK